jgi:4,5-dihydroxyphthalate decarboxylase
MAKLNLSVAVGPYDRTRALIDGSVQIDGVKPACMTLSPEEIFFRAFRQAEFDICELSLSSFTVKTAQGNCPYVGVPAFVSRAFRHTSIYVRTDRIKKPGDLKGKKVGLPEYQLTANVWARAILEDDHGVRPSDIHWVRGGIEDADRPEKISIKLPPDVQRGCAEGKSISTLLRTARSMALSPRAILAKTPRTSAGFSRTRLPPLRIISSARVFSRSCIWSACDARWPKHPWLPGAVFKAFEQAKKVAIEQLSDTSATKVTLPFVEERISEARALMGEDFWSYGVAANRKTLETFLRHHHSQGLSSRLVTVEEMFHPGTLETFKL